MSDTDAQVPLPDLNAADAPPIDDVAYLEDEQASRVAADLELAHHEMRQRCGHDRGVADASGFQDGDTLVLRVGDRVGNAALIRIKPDRAGFCGSRRKADVGLDPSRKRVMLGGDTDHCRKLSRPLWLLSV